jgi:hypothetical protein
MQHLVRHGGRADQAAPSEAMTNTLAHNKPGGRWTRHRLGTSAW